MVCEESDAIRDQRLFGTDSPVFEEYGHAQTMFRSVQKHYFYECHMRRRFNIIGALTFCICVIYSCDIK